MDSHQEKELFLQVSEGSESAFTTLVEVFGPQLEKAVFQVIRTEGAVSDIVQDIFLHTWLDREKIGQLQDPRTWLFRIAYYRSYTWLRNHGTRRRITELINIHSVPASNEVEENFSLQETKKFIGEAIATLSPRARSIYLLSRNEHMKTDEIATHLGISQQTVKNTLTTALNQIRQYLRQKGIYLPLILFLLRQP